MGLVKQATRTGAIVNDVHARISRTRVARIAEPRDSGEVAGIVRRARERGESLSVAGSRHSMGGQPFATGAILLDTSGLDSIGNLDPERGTVDVGAGVRWPALVAELHARQRGSDGIRDGIWTISQKQTGADRLTIGGAVSSNVHGRGLAMAPLVGDLEALEIVDPDGCVLECSRESGPDVFRSVVGGYGMFGVVTSARLRLARRRRLVRRVRLAPADESVRILEQHAGDGALYGDFQFAIDPDSDAFLRDGILSSYFPAEERGDAPSPRALDESDWRRLIRLAHEAPSQGFAEYAAHYLATDGGLYWSDTHQLGTYVDGYHDELDARAGECGSEVIGELYVPRGELPRFLALSRELLRRDRARVIYGTVRLIERDRETLLAWARERWACVVLNLHTGHTPRELEATAATFRGLIEIARELGGSYYLTYHRWATRAQAQACHPALPRFVALKRELDPAEVLTSDWWRALSRWYPPRPPS